ncbi:hypothetical protein EGM51_05355 [Verrucomicrobia bacterium S94]|nr:hypothetical protein EGM51_05355 [Verrucomicrobia bacterium S94]
MKIPRMWIAASALLGLAVHATAAVTLLVEDFEAFNQGDAFGVNASLTNETYDAGMRFNNMAVGEVVVPDANFISASGTNVLQLTTATNNPTGGFGELTADNAPRAVSLTLGDDVVFSFDMYVQALPAGTSGIGLELRGGSGNTLVSSAFEEFTGASVGDVVHVSWTNSVTAAIALESALSFKIKIEGNGANFDPDTDVMQIDNLKLEIIPVELPANLVSGTFIDSGFVSSEGYSDTDLAGQAGWEQVAGSSNQAFSVINSASTGEADTATAGNFSTNTGNAVYWSDYTLNNAADAWEGYVDFSISATSDGTGEIGNYDVLAFGITADKDAPLHLEDNDNMALMTLKVRNFGNLVAMFGDESIDTDETRLDYLKNGEESGFNPMSPSNPTGNDYESDVIRYHWQIRKTTQIGTYQATATFSNLTSGFVQTNYTTLGVTPSVIHDKEGLYSSPSVNFVIGHYYKAQQGEDERIDVKIHAVNVTHSTNNISAPNPPESVVAEGGDRAVELFWDAALEATSYDVLFAESAGGPQTVIAEGITDQFFVDTPRFNGITNYYTVRANYANGSADSEEVPGVPFASIRQIFFDGRDASWSGVVMDQDTGVTNNGTMTWVEYVEDVNPYYSPELYPGVGADVILYGLSQYSGVYSNLTMNTGDTWRYNVRNNVDGDHFQWYLQGLDGAPFMNQLKYVRSIDMTVPKTSIDLTEGKHSVTFSSLMGQSRLAIRNNGIWYVGETLSDGGVEVTYDNLVDDENWAAVTIIPGTPFVEPSSFTADSSTFTDVDAIGWYCMEDDLQRFETLIYDAEGSIPSPEYWMNENGISDMMADDNTNGVINLKEYAFNRDPVNDEGQKNLPELTASEYMGTNGFIFVSVELRDPESGISYSLETTENLVSVGFAPDDEVVKIGEGNIDYYTRAVTNFIPATAAAKFIDLKITETP